MLTPILIAMINTSSMSAAKINFALFRKIPKNRQIHNDISKANETTPRAVNGITLSSQRWPTVRPMAIPHVKIPMIVPIMAMTMHTVRRGNNLQQQLFLSLIFFFESFCSMVWFKIMISIEIIFFFGVCRWISMFNQTTQTIKLSNSHTNDTVCVCKYKIISSSIEKRIFWKYETKRYVCN